MLWDITTDRNVELLNQITIITFQRALNPEKTQSWSPPYLLVSTIVYKSFCGSHVTLRQHKAWNHNNALHWTALSWMNNDIRWPKTTVKHITRLVECFWMEPQRNSVFQHGPLALQMPKRYNLLFQLSYLAIISTKIFHQPKLGRYFFWQ